jgi:hypothetical protein
MEIWIDVFGFEGFYKVSNFGNIKSVERIDAAGKLRKERMRIFVTTKDGYKSTSIWANKKQTHVGVHRVVWQSFNKKLIPIGQEINHINGIRDDNRPENLEAMTHADNVKYSKDVLNADYATYGNGRMTVDQRSKIFELRNQGLSFRAIAKILGFSKTQIMNVYNGHCWNIS